MEIQDLDILIVADKVQSEVICNEIYECNIESVQFANNNNDAISKINEHNFHIIICSHNEKSECNGQTLIQTVRENWNHKHSFMLIMESKDKDIILGSLEFVPDDITVQSFEELNFKNRFLKIAERHTKTLEIRKALEEGDTERVIKLCNKAMMTQNITRQWSLRHILNSLIEEKKFNYIEKFATDVLNKKNIEFVHVALLEALYNQSKYDRLIFEAKKSRNNHPLSIKTHILMGEGYYQLGELENAVKCFKAATSLSPLSEIAKNKLQNINKVVEHNNKAIASYQQLLDIAKHAFQDKPEIYLSLYKSIKSSNNLPIRKVIKKALKVIEKAYRSFPDSEVIHIHNILFQAQLEHEKGNTEEAIHNVISLCNRFTNKLETNVMALVNTIITLHLLGEEGKSKYYNEKLNILIEETKSANNNHISIDEIEKEINNEKPVETNTIVICEEHENIEEFNRLGTKLLKKGDIAKSIELIQIAVKNKPENIKYSLNLIEAYLNKIEKEGNTEDTSFKCKTLMLKLTKMILPEDDENNFNQLKNRFNSLIAKDHELLFA